MDEGSGQRIELDDIKVGSRSTMSASEAEPTTAELRAAFKNGRTKSRHNMTTTDPAERDRSVAIGTLLYAASRGDGAEVLKLLSQGTVSVNDGDYDKRTALHIASAEGHYELVKDLVSCGVDVNSKDRWGNTPLDDAIRHGFDKVAVYLKRNSAIHGQHNFGQELINAAGSGDMATIKRLVESGISVDSVDYDKRTPLHIAVAERNQDVVEYLLSKGANPNAVDRFGGTPITEANRNGVRIGEDDIKLLLSRHSGETAPSWYHRFFHPFVFVVAGFQILFFILFAIFLEYDHDAFGGYDPNDTFATVYEYYPMYMDVHVMIFIGFGFLMTFLRKYGYTAVGLNFLLGVMCIQWYLLVSAFFQDAINLGFSTPAVVSIRKLLQADFAAGAVLISFGALLGKTSPVQMVFLAMFEVVFYSLNEAIAGSLQISDIGGSYIIHMFGAYFGLAASLVLTPRGARGNRDNSAVYRSDLFSMIGTIFLWIYWPSFNAATGVGATQHRAIVNTVLSISASCVSAFLFSFIIRGERKFNMVDVQNATLAGGVAMGASADLILHPAVVIGVGFLAGCISVFGFSFLQPRIEKTIGLHDTAGVHNLHGMPSLLAAFTCIIASAWAPYNFYGVQLYNSFPARQGSRSAGTQALLQLAFLGITLGIAIVGGLITGVITKWIGPPHRYFLDDEFWEVPELELPYYFDKRGEIIRIDEEITKRVGAPDLVETRSTKETQEMEARILSLESKLEKMTNRLAASIASNGTVGVGPAVAPEAQTLLIQSLTQAINLLSQKKTL